jgi:HSP20 family protein
MFSVIPWKKYLLNMPVGYRSPFMPLGNVPAMMKRMQNEFDELFTRFYGELPFPVSAITAGWPWEFTTEDKPTEIVIKAEAPGFEVGDFEIEVRGSELIVRAAKKAETKEGGKYREVVERKCYESVTLPPGINPDKIEAKYQNGVLTVAIPKTDEGKGRKVAVQGT